MSIPADTQNKYLTIVNTSAVHRMCVDVITRHITTMQNGGEEPTRESIVGAVATMMNLNPDLIEKHTDLKFRGAKPSSNVAVSSRVVDHLRDYWEQKIPAQKGESPKQEETMSDKNATLLSVNPDTVYVKKEFVFGRDIDQMTNDEMIEAVARLEHEVKHLGSIKTKAKGIDAKKAALEQAIERLAERLNA